jgi:hypothetical protein
MAKPPEERVYKTSKRHFKLFCDEINKFIDIFGLVGWEVYFEHKQYLSNVQAVCITDQQGRFKTNRPGSTQGSISRSL